MLEALQNVQKYAEATRAMVRLADAGGKLCFEISDDGKGFDTGRAMRGSGLTNMADRLDAVGGGVEIDWTPGRGTRRVGRVPTLDLVSA